MKNKLAKLKYLPNNFDIIQEGDHVICAISGKKIFLPEMAQITWSPSSIIAKLLGKYFNLANLFFTNNIYK